MRAASTACTVAGTWMAGRAWPGDRPRLTHQHPGLHQVRTLSSRKKGIALGARDQELLERCQAGVVPQQGLQEASALAGGSGSSRSCV